MPVGGGDGGPDGPAGWLPQAVLSVSRESQPSSLQPPCSPADNLPDSPLS